MMTCSAWSQTTVEWIGGTPGKETKWEEARNWSPQVVPDYTCKVVLPGYQTGHAAQPMVDGFVEVLSIEVHQGATLYIKESGEVLIDGTDVYTEGIKNYGGQLHIDGALELKKVAGASLAELFEISAGQGSLIVNEQVFQSECFANQ